MSSEAEFRDTEWQEAGRGTELIVSLDGKDDQRGGESSRSGTVQAQSLADATAVCAFPRRSADARSIDLRFPNLPSLTGTLTDRRFLWAMSAAIGPRSLPGV
jgi:hypothetical protein